MRPVRRDCRGERGRDRPIAAASNDIALGAGAFASHSAMVNARLMASPTSWAVALAGCSLPSCSTARAALGMEPSMSLHP